MRILFDAGPTNGQFTAQVLFLHVLTMIKVRIGGVHMDVRNVWLVVAVVGAFHRTSGHVNADGGGGTRKRTA